MLSQGEDEDGRRRGRGSAIPRRIRRDLRLHQLEYFISKSAFIGTEACNHGSQELCWDDRIVVYLMAGQLPKKRKKCELRPAVALAKWMNGVKIAQEMCGFSCEVLPIQAAEIVSCLQSCEQAAHLGIDIFGIAEHAVGLADAHGAQAARPAIDIAEEVTVQSAVMRVAQASSRSGSSRRCVTIAASKASKAA